jgi:hypothetical protein
VLSAISECSSSPFSGSPWSPVSATLYIESISSSNLPLQHLLHLLNQLFKSPSLCLSSSLSSLSQTRQLIS